MHTTERKVDVMPVPSLKSLCAQVLYNSNVTVTDPDADIEYLNALIQANETVKVHKEQFLTLQAELMAYLETTLDETSADEDLNATLDLSNKVAQQLRKMQPMVDWMDPLKDDSFYAHTYASYKSMYDWLKAAQAQLTPIIKYITDYKAEATTS